MCEVCTDMVVNTLVVNTYDPTKTLSLRNAFTSALNSRFNALKRDIRYAVITDDVFGLKTADLTAFSSIAVYASPGHKAYQFGSSQEKINQFMAWLGIQQEAGLLQLKELKQVGKAVNEVWTDTYVLDSYKRGVMRARYEMEKAGYGIPSLDATGGIAMSMSTPFHIDRLGILYSRTFQELKGITSQMDSQISRVLAAGMADGDGPALLARKMISVIDGSNSGTLNLTDTLGRFIPAQRRAEIMARTEIIRAHHQATVQEYRNWGVEGVNVQAEFKTAGDERVCSQCASLEGTVWTLDEIENKIPVHPQCRCIALPKDITDGKKDVKTQIEEAARQNDFEVRLEDAIAKTEVKNLASGIPDEAIYVDYQAFTTKAIRSAEQLRKEFGSPISSEVLTGRNYEYIPTGATDKIREVGMKELNIMFDKQGTSMLPISDLHMQKWVFENPIKAAGDKASSIIKFEGKYYVIDGNNTLAKRILMGNTEVPVKLLDFDMGSTKYMEDLIAAAKKDPVAKGFIDMDEAVQYMEARAKYDEIFATMPDQMKVDLKTIFAQGDKYLDPDQQNALQRFVRDYYRGDRSIMDEIVQNWCSDTAKKQPQAFRYIGTRIEKDLPHMKFKEGRATLEDMMEWITEQAGGEAALAKEYIEWRAFNQSIMSTFFPSDVPVLYRGIGGKTGRQLAMSYHDHKLNPASIKRQTTHDLVFVGSSSEMSEAMKFALNEDVEMWADGRKILKTLTMVRNEHLAYSDIIASRYMWATLFHTSFEGEMEWILRGKANHLWKGSQLRIRVYFVDGGDFIYGFID